MESIHIHLCEQLKHKKASYLNIAATSSAGCFGCATNSCKPKLRRGVFRLRSRLRESQICQFSGSLRGYLPSAEFAACVTASNSNYVYSNQG